MAWHSRSGSRHVQFIPGLAKFGLSQLQIDSDIQGAMQSPASTSLPEQECLLHFGLAHERPAFPGFENLALRLRCFAPWEQETSTS